MQPIILCAGEHGRCLVFGFTEAEPTPNKAVTLYRARMILSFPSGGTFGLAANGPPNGSRLTATVAKTVETCWQEWLAVSPDAAQRLAEYTT